MLKTAFYFVVNFYEQSVKAMNLSFWKMEKSMYECMDG